MADVKLLTEFAPAPGPASKRKTRASVYEDLIQRLIADEDAHGKWVWIGVYGVAETAKQTASRLRKQYPGIRFAVGEHPVGKYGLQAYYEPEDYDPEEVF